MSIPTQNDRSSKWDRRYREALDAAATAFAEGGYLGSSTKDIADRMGIQQGSLYYYLPSKEAALAAICEVGVTKFVTRLGEILASSKSSREKLHLAVDNHLSPLRTRPEADYIRVFVMHRHQLPAGPRHVVAALARRYHSLIEQLFTEGVRKGDFRADLNPQLATHAMFGLCNSVIGARSMPSGVSVDRIIADYTEILTEGVGSAKRTASAPRSRKNRNSILGS